LPIRISSGTFDTPIAWKTRCAASGCSMTSNTWAQVTVLIAALSTVGLLARTVTDAEINRFIEADDAGALQQALGAEPGWTARILFNKTTEERGDLLTIAAGEGAIHIVSALLAAGADVNGEQPIASRENVWGHSPLYLACLHDKTNVVRALLAAGADATRFDAAGFGPLHVAAAFGRLESVRALIESGVSADLPSQRGDTALKFAVMKRQTDVAIYLLGKRANPNAADVRGDTALHEAARNDDGTMVVALLAHGARPVKNHYGRTPADEARSWAPDLLDVLGDRTPARGGRKTP
jgi:hypothetical protein